MSKPNKKGLFVGASHDNGGIPSIVVDTGQEIEIEGQEYYICREAYNSPKVFDFKGKTNREVLDEIYTNFSCKLVQEKMNAGDFIVCKIVVKDSKKHNRKGTVKHIINKMQQEKSCRVEVNPAELLKKGGKTVDTIKKSYVGNAVIYNDKMYYISEKDGSFGLINLSSGAWGSDYPFFIPKDWSKVESMSGVKYDKNVVIKHPEYRKGGELKLNTVHVKFKNSDNNYYTSIGSSVTEEEARNYFVGKRFNVAPFPKEKMEEVIDIEFIDNNKMSKGGEISLNDWVSSKKGTARGQIYKMEGDSIWLRDKWGNEDSTRRDVSDYKLSSKPRYSYGGNVGGWFIGELSFLNW